MKKQPPLVEVVWVDAVTHDGPWSIPDAEKLATLSERRSSGYLIKKTARVVAIAHTFDLEDNEVADITCIPRHWVKIIRQSRKERKEKK